MSDLIDRQAAIDAVDEWESIHSWNAWCYEHKDEAKKFHINAPTAVIENLPSAQPQHMKGKWIDKSGGIEGAWNYCSVCGEQAIDLYDFCPNCGADMRGDEDAAD